MDIAGSEIPILQQKWDWKHTRLLMVDAALVDKQRLSSAKLSFCVLVLLAADDKNRALEAAEKDKQGALQVWYFLHVSLWLSHALANGEAIDCHLAQEVQHTQKHRNGCVNRGMLVPNQSVEISHGNFLDFLGNQLYILG